MTSGGFFFARKEPAMILIRTAEALAHALDSPLDAVAKERLRFHAERLSLGLALCVDG